MFHGIVEFSSSMFWDPMGPPADSDPRTFRFGLANTQASRRNAAADYADLLDHSPDSLGDAFFNHESWGMNKQHVFFNRVNNDGNHIVNIFTHVKLP